MSKHICRFLFEHGMRFCVPCNRILSLAHFGEDARDLYGYQSYCRECRAEKDRARRAKEKPHYNPIPSKTIHETVRELKEKGWM